MTFGSTVEVLDKSLSHLRDYDILLFIYSFFAITSLLVFGLIQFQHLQTLKKRARWRPRGPYIGVQVLRSPWVGIWAIASLVFGLILIGIGGKDLARTLRFYDQAYLLNLAPHHTEREKVGQGKAEHWVYTGDFLIDLKDQQVPTRVQGRHRLKENKRVKILWSPISPQTARVFSFWSLFGLSATTLPSGIILCFVTALLLKKLLTDSQIRKTWKLEKAQVMSSEFRVVKGGFLLHAFFAFTHPQNQVRYFGVFSVVTERPREDLKGLNLRLDPKGVDRVAIESRLVLSGIF